MLPRSIQTSSQKEATPVYEIPVICKAIKQSVEGKFPLPVKVRGEIFQLTTSKNGHVYITLKGIKTDEILQAVIWRDTPIETPEQGSKVICTGRIKVYTPQSRYQLIIESVELEGEGKLWALLDELRKKLSAEGIFDKKRPIPFLPETIGIITSPQGAVLQDILHRLRDRFPRKIILCPVSVQGEGSATQIIHAIKRLNQIEEKPDVIIIARGGGSLQDLWCFNQEEVVRAVYSSSIPVISAIGHETDHTLVDDASDFRCPTPTAAAEKAVPVRNDLQEKLSMLRLALGESLTHQVHLNKSKLEHLSQSISSLPASLLNEKRRNLHQLLGQLSLKQVRSLLVRQQEKLSMLRLALGESFAYKVNYLRSNLTKYSDVLDALSYKGVLERGYACIRSSDNKIITRVNQAKKEAKLKVEFADGTLPVKNIT